MPGDDGQIDLVYIVRRIFTGITDGNLHFQKYGFIGKVLFPSVAYTSTSHCIAL